MHPHLIWRPAFLGEGGGEWVCDNCIFNMADICMQTHYTTSTDDFEVQLPSQ